MEIEYTLNGIIRKHKNYEPDSFLPLNSMIGCVPGLSPFSPKLIWMNLTGYVIRLNIFEYPAPFSSLNNKIILPLGKEGMWASVQSGPTWNWWLNYVNH